MKDQPATSAAIEQVTGEFGGLVADLLGPEFDVVTTLEKEDGSIAVRTRFRFTTPYHVEQTVLMGPSPEIDVAEVVRRLEQHHRDVEQRAQRAALRATEAWQAAMREDL